MRIDPTSFNPILGYKLDPGEPGLAHSAPASMSVLRVLSQEVSNYLAFKKEAMEKGGFIIMGGIYLDLRKRGGFLAAVAGKTRVFMYLPGEKNVEEGAERPGRREIEQKIQELEMKLQTETDPLEREKLKKEIEMLKMALNALSASMKLPEYLVGELLDVLV